jgi:hypothetical protein
MEEQAYVTNTLGYPVKFYLNKDYDEFQWRGKYTHGASWIRGTRVNLTKYSGHIRERQDSFHFTWRCNEEDSIISDCGLVGESPKEILTNLIYNYKKISRKDYADNERYNEYAHNRIPEDLHGAIYIDSYNHMICLLKGDDTLNYIIEELEHAQIFGESKGVEFKWW